jgi:hypothetical protein
MLFSNAESLPWALGLRCREGTELQTGSDPLNTRFQLFADDFTQHILQSLVSILHVFAQRFVDQRLFDSQHPFVFKDIHGIGKIDAVLPRI